MIDEQNISRVLSFLIKKQRRANNLTQRQLAEKVGLSTRHIGKLEDGTYLPKFITYLKLSEVLHFDTSDVCSLTKTVATPCEIKIFSLVKQMKSDEIALCIEMMELLVKRRKNA